jgi:hypothetical protein
MDLSAAIGKLADKTIVFSEHGVSKVVVINACHGNTIIF